MPDLAVCVEGEHEEVLGVEFLPAIGMEAADVDDLVRLVATLNALTDAPWTIATPAGMPQPEFEQLLATAMDDVAARWPEHRSGDWLQLYRSAARSYLTLPRALTHGELAAQQVGRTEDGRLVVFDLATVGMRPRFADLANLLQALGRLEDGDEQSVLRRYLGHLARAGGPACSLERPGRAEADPLRAGGRSTSLAHRSARCR